MELFDSELQYLSELYQHLEREMARAEAGGEHQDRDAMIDVILANRELFSRIGQTNGKVQQLADEWEKYREHLDPEYRAKTQKFAAAVARQAADLNKTLSEYRAEVETRRAQLASELSELGKGSRYLQCVKPLKANYPKFIDSLG